ncbi:hypothetical protein, partial [Streptomyces sp. NPDC019539]|uniref:hypothetical protein n=1 Tax=Streptomyces sp. NPDC019539 TaxID=3365063 RepID=UPI0037A29961
VLRIRPERKWFPVAPIRSLINNKRFPAPHAPLRLRLSAPAFRLGPLCNSVTARRFARMAHARAGARVPSRPDRGRLDHAAIRELAVG